MHFETGLWLEIGPTISVFKESVKTVVLFMVPASVCGKDSIVLPSPDFWGGGAEVPEWSGKRNGNQGQIKGMRNRRQER